MVTRYQRDRSVQSGVYLTKKSRSTECWIALARPGGEAAFTSVGRSAATMGISQVAGGSGEEAVCCNSVAHSKVHCSSAESLGGEVSSGLENHMSLYSLMLKALFKGWGIGAWALFMYRKSGPSRGSTGRMAGGRSEMSSAWYFSVGPSGLLSLRRR